ncbi:hypothetical protein CP8484711_2121B, partial [Chlamydia psittaci 84-8471/1]
HARRSVPIVAARFKSYIDFATLNGF